MGTSVIIPAITIGLRVGTAPFHQIRQSLPADMLSLQGQ